MTNTQKAIDSTAEYRNLPKIKKGQRCEVEGESGVIWGGNHAANFNVKFDGGGISNCHPGYKMKIFANDGSIIHESGE